MSFSFFFAQSATLPKFTSGHFRIPARLIVPTHLSITDGVSFPSSCLNDLLHDHILTFSDFQKIPREIEATVGTSYIFDGLLEYIHKEGIDVDSAADLLRRAVTYPRGTVIFLEKCEETIEIKQTITWLRSQLDLIVLAATEAGSDGSWNATNVFDPTADVISAPISVSDGETTSEDEAEVSPTNPYANSSLISKNIVQNLAPARVKAIEMLLESSLGLFIPAFPFAMPLATEQNTSPISAILRVLALSGATGPSNSQSTTSCFTSMLGKPGATSNGNRGTPKGGSSVLLSAAMVGDLDVVVSDPVRRILHSLDTWLSLPEENHLSPLLRGCAFVLSPERHFEEAATRQWSPVSEGDQDRVDDASLYFGERTYHYTLMSMFISYAR